MSYMRDASGTRLDSVQVVARTGFQAFRSGNFPGSTALPVVNAAAATVTLSAANAASAITNKATIFPTHESYRVISGNPTIGTAFPDTLGWIISTQWTNTSFGPWGVEFEVDSLLGVFEILTKGSSGNFRILINDVLLSAAGLALPNDGASYLITVTLPAAGAYRVRLEMNASTRFWGINVGPTDLVQAGSRKRPRFAWLGDSFAEPTISDSISFSPWSGLPSVFGYCTGLEIVNAGSGGTGLVNPGTGGRVKYADRLPEVLAFPNLDGLIIQMSGNDQTYTTAEVLVQLQACITAAQASGLTKYGQVVVVSTWWLNRSSGIPASLLDKNDQARALCATLGIPFVDTLTPPISNPASGTITTATSTGSNNVLMSFKPPVGSFLKLGTGTTTEVRAVSNANLTGASTAPYTVQMDTNPSQAHAIGDPVLQVGGSLLTGTGKLSAPTGVGSSDRMTGTDGTHPTVAGHRARGIQYASALGRVLAR